MIMNDSGLTMTIVFEASSANYGESLGNVASLKKLTRGNGFQYTYISRQALRYNIVEQLGESLAKLSAEGAGDKKVIQFSKDSSIVDYPEIDFFGYMKTVPKVGAVTRSAKVRLSNAISQEPFAGDVDFLTNMGLATRIRNDEKDNSINNSIAQAEVHTSYYCYTVTIDLDQIGVDINEPDVNLDMTERSRRVQKLLQTIQYLYRDIKGRREDLKPLFVIGGIYDIKNPIFENVVKVEKNKINLASIKDVMSEDIAKNTLVGIVSDKFLNSDVVKEELGATSVAQVFDSLKTKVADYYEGD